MDLFKAHYHEHVWREAARALDERDTGRLQKMHTDLDAWIRQYPYPADGAWDPYTAARRLFHWGAVLAVSDVAPTSLHTSYLHQLHFVRKTLEFDLRANHLLVECAAICFAESLLYGEPRRSSLELLQSEVAEQVLPDGGHFERSPMYHTLILLDLLRVRALLPAAPEWLDKALRDMTDFLAGVTFPDGEFTLVHDSVSGEAPPARAVASLATAILELSRSACGPQAFTATGFYRMQAGGMTAVVFAGEVGPPYQPGHAHADIFSFELFADAQRVFVDAGMHGYAGSALRPWCRSVVAHNTAQVGNREPVECWSVFRVAHRYRVRLLAWRETPRGRLLCAQHDGYGDTRHCRAILASAEGGLWVMDLLTGPGHESVTSRLHLHPALQFVRRSEGEFSVSGAGVQVCVWGAVIAEINPSWYCPRFGDALENQVLRLTAQPAPDVCLGYGIFADSDAISAAHRQEMFEWLVEQARKLSE